MENEFNADPFFNDGPLQQINEGSLQQIDQIDPAGVGIDALNNVPLPVNPLIVQRILNLHQGGSSTRLCWSRQGHIANISEDGSSIDLHCLVFDRTRRTWVVGAKRTEHVGLGELASLAWSPMATDIAVVDTRGRLSILRPTGTAANRLSEVRSGTIDDIQDLGQAIGMGWLSQDRAERPKQVVQFTSKQEGGDKWVHNLVKAMPMQPLYQRAIVVINRQGTMALVYEKPDSTFAKTTSQLAPKTDTIFTHAAFSPTTEGKLMVALHAHDGTLSAYHVSIDFSPMRQDPDALPLLNSQLAASRFPRIGNTSIDGQMYDSDSQCLTHLGIIPTSEIEKTAPQPPTVYGIYANINKNMGATDGGFISSGTIRRWTLSSVHQTLLPKFNHLPDKATNSAPVFTTSVQLLPEKEEQGITNAGVLDNGQGLFITTLDGRTDFLATEDLSSLSFAASENTTSSLAQSGFNFPLLSNQTSISLSPNVCCSAVLSPASTVSLVPADFHPPTAESSQSLDPTSSSADAAAAVIVLSFARSCWTNSNIDDLLSMVLHTFSASMATPLIVSLYHTLFREGEFMHEKDSRSELEKVVQKPVLTKVFSFHYGVAFLSIKDVPPSSPIPLSAQWVWVAANLRFVAQLLYISIREVQNPSAEPSSELVEMVCGNIKWTLDLVRYIAASIFEVSDRETNPEFFDKPQGGHVVDGSQGLVALLLNCHWSRQFFIAIVRAMRVLCKLPEPRSAQQTEIIRTIMQWSQGKGLSLIAVEALLDPRWSGWADNELEGDLAKISSRQIRMMATGVVEGGFQGTVRRVLGKLFNVKGGMRDKGAVDRLKLWSHKVDLGWVLLDDEWEGARPEGRKKRVFDVHKKKVITKGKREIISGESGEEMIKRCVRCGRHNEDVNGMGKEFPRHVAGLMMRCVCDGPWIVEPWAKAIT
ncbi:uncharacterized protein HMPREF1541_00335 [Cyphellophora europaea CBS 101466]|uniref:Mediator of RNA polymerase II transcription subunit 16 n=1 Tax=Cyphellophora europaea (strain CBS 101466) TaxID=1220924 RepID=W2SBP0_CYPE1|nr:uncharacterized protein HMPREF1541_00335 [Cyphellophora europaea CBS 101466]ETN46151.1 hypothetical protein HMPREF1541_00335 [Cyphellophora europaea CBS 101466]